AVRSNGTAILIFLLLTWHMDVGAMCSRHTRDSLLSTCDWLLIPPRQHEGADQNHGGAQELAHGEGSEDQPEVEVRFSKKLHDHATEAVAGDEAPTDGAGRGRLTADQPQHDEQEPAFQSCFVELRRVPAFGPAAREDDAQRYITRTAVEFPVDKIHLAHQHKTDGN